MSGTSLQFYPLVIPNPDALDGQDPHATAQISSSYGDHFVSQFGTFRTLSTNGVHPAAQPSGLFYVPELEPGSCTNASAPFVPANVTRLEDLPSNVQGRLAVAPWLSPACTQQYLAAAADASPQGFVFFLPNNDGDQPPDASDVAWGLGDGDWKMQNHFPVYAIPGRLGMLLMSTLGAYSGNMTEAPSGNNLTKIFDSKDYVRIFGVIDTAGGTGALPSLWVFLLIVLGVLLAVIASTSLLMHFLQRRRRSNLRRRVANGEVDLEVLGIKRLTVPQALLDDLPLYAYGTERPVTSRRTRSTAVAEKNVSGAPSIDADPTKAFITLPTPTLVRETSYHPSPLQQPTCAICLDDFIIGDSNTNGTTVRELPCHHIFHPECVDTFLRDSSSLCPICKRSALPQGYCPRLVTNAMVRRERTMRRMRERMTNGEDRHEGMTQTEDDGMPHRSNTGARIHCRVFSGLSSLRPGRRADSALAHDGQRPMTEMSVPSSSANLSSSGTPAGLRVQPRSSPGRREWARQRAVSMLGRDAAPPDPEADEVQRTPAWRKALRGVFPVAR
nr:putative ring finger membrane protein c15c4.06c [Quercus suber]